MRLNAFETKMLAEMLEHYQNRVQQATMQASIPGRNPMFKVQAGRDQARADLIRKIIEQIIVE